MVSYYDMTNCSLIPQEQRGVLKERGGEERGGEERGGEERRGEKVIYRRGSTGMVFFGGGLVYGTP